MTEWKEVRRSVPAEHVDGVADDATVYACWMEDDGVLAFTVYKDADEVKAWLVKHDGERNEVIVSVVLQCESQRTLVEYHSSRG